jgi:hypothetical protein
MANQLYPLIYKPGIKRDGTTFQADFCTDGQWVRFQRGNIRKMGSMQGMKGIGRENTNGKPTTTNITILPEKGNTSDMQVYLANSSGINRVRTTQGVANSVYNNIYVANNDNLIWKSEIIIQNDNKHIVYVGSYNKFNISDEIPSTLVSGVIGQNLKDLVNPPKDQRGICGALFASNYLFLYGSNGLVQWSKLKEPLDFTDSQNRNITISNDQVVDAKSIRGGTNSPTILFWTLSSVVRCINTPDTGGNLQFQIDVMSKSSSILSTRCVVEYDGLFFWPGTNRFFQYNGIVQELANTMSLNYFYNNLDMSRRQQVVGVKNTQYGEIWWFYPERMNAPNRDPNIPEGENSRAIIYNIRENAWYDTIISRSAAIYSEDFGFMASYGYPLSAPENGNTALFRHEYEYLTVNPNEITENFILSDGTEKKVAIPSFFTTPVFSWAAFNPMKQLTGSDRWMLLVTIEPDFILLPANPDLKVIINTKQYAQNIAISSDNFDVPPLQVLQGPISSNDILDCKIDTCFQGRHMTLTFTSNLSNFEMGHVMLSLGLGDGK